MISSFLSFLKANVCANSGVMHVMVILGYLLVLIKVLVPILIIIMGMKKMVEVVLNNETEIRSAVFDLMKRFFVGATIFFIPTLFSFVFEKMVNTNIDSEFINCTNCMLKPSNCYKQVLTQKEEERKELQQKLEEEKNKQNSNNNDDTDNSEPLDANFNYHTNSINGIKYALYNQTDPKWKDIGNIGESGCHIVSAAVVASGYDKSITPATVYSKHKHSYPYNVVNDLAGGGFTCKHISASTSKENIIQELKKGNPIVIMVYGKNKGGTSSFTSSQHYMALIDYKDGQIFVGNSYSTSGYGRSGWYDEDQVLQSIREINLCSPTEKMLDNTNSQEETNVTLKYSYHTYNTLRYAMYTPSSASHNTKTPLIVWLHGSGEINASESTFKNSGLLATLNNWSLDGFNAYVLCPISNGSWINVRSKLYELIEDVIESKNIDRNNIVLVGHSMGGIGVQTIANNNVNYFSSYVILSGYNAGVNLDQFKTSKIRAYVGSPSYGEDNSSYNYTVGTLTNALGSSNIRVLSTSHGQVPNVAFNLDENKDNKSDLIQCMFN